MKTMTSKKLNLGKETLRTLGTNELSQVAGGVTQTLGCPPPPPVPSLGCAATLVGCATGNPTQNLGRTAICFV